MGISLTVTTVSVVIGGFPSTSYVVVLSCCVIMSNGILHVVLAMICG